MKSSTALAEQQKETNTGLSVFDSGQFEQMWAVSDALAASSLVPDSLKGKTNEETRANCLRVVEQASRWQLSPFAVMDCASVVHGKLMWEGKLVSAALEAKVGIRLNFNYEGSGLQRKVTVSGRFPDETEDRIITGTVEQWQTTANGSPWKKPAQHDQQLSYRGSREWTRRHAPGVILGVYSPDEFEEAPPRELRTANGRVVKQETSDPFATQNCESQPHGQEVRVQDGDAPSAHDSAMTDSSQPEPEPKNPTASAEVANTPVGEVEGSGSQQPQYTLFINEVNEVGDKFEITVSNEKEVRIVSTTLPDLGKEAKSQVNNWVIVTLGQTRNGIILTAIKPLAEQPNLI